MRMREIMTIVEGTVSEAHEHADHRPEVLVNPTRAAAMRLLRKTTGRMSVDDEANVFLWPARKLIHSDVAKRYGLVKSGSGNRLSGLSLYAFEDGVAARVQEVEDEQVHPGLTSLARQLPNLVRIWGPNVTVIDMHWEP